MIDTIKIYSFEYNFSDIDMLKLTNIKEARDDDGNIKSIQGKFQNFNITANINSIWITGSLATYCFGNNFKVMSYKEISKTIKRLKNELELNIDSFNISRLDIVGNLKMNYSIPIYLQCLKELSRFKVSYYNDGSKTFYNTRKSLCFYDKVEEHNKKHKGNYLEDPAQNILRYELRIKQVSKAFKKILVQALHSESILDELHDIWIKEYHKIIKKKKCIDISRLTINKPNDVFQFLAYSKIQELEEDDFELIMKKSKAKLKPSSYHYLRSKINKPMDNISYTTKYIDELDSKINNYAKGQTNAG